MKPIIKFLSNFFIRFSFIVWIIPTIVLLCTGIYFLFVSVWDWNLHEVTVYIKEFIPNIIYFIKQPLFRIYILICLILGFIFSLEEFDI